MLRTAIGPLGQCTKRGAVFGVRMRSLAYSAPAFQPLDLAFDVQMPTSGDGAVAKHTKGLVICHGL